MKRLIYLIMAGILTTGCSPSSDSSTPALPVGPVLAQTEQAGVQADVPLLSCPEGQYVVGVFGQAGWWIDQVGIRCAGLREALAKESELKSKVGVSLGGDFFDYLCPQGTAVAEIKYGNDRHCGIHETCLQPAGTLNSIQVICSQPQGEIVSQSPVFGGHYQSQTNEHFKCQSGFMTSVSFEKQKTEFVGKLTNINCQ